MKITFFGAAGEVTGSCTLLETSDAKILIDCGAFQGGEEHEKKNYLGMPFDPALLNAVFVTHAHLDHVGRLPLLVKNGFEGFFYATSPTLELTRLILEDAYSIMEYDNKKTGKPLLYEKTDIEKVMSQFKAVEYYERFTLNVRSSGLLTKTNPNEPIELHEISVIFKDAGHIFGSAFIEIKSEGKKIVFSGDVGNENVPILRDTDALPHDIDLLVCESTYGDRLHEPTSVREALLERAVRQTASQNGVLMIPSFALERTQELLYAFNNLIERFHLIKSMPVYLDSPLAIDTLKVFEKFPQYYDKDATLLFKGGDNVFDFEGLHKTYTRDESMTINSTHGSKIIIAGAGMMNGGRILHHAMRYLSDHKNSILFIGYQAPGTLGSRILAGADHVQIMGERVSVHADVKMIDAFSAHGDKFKIFKWASGGKPKRIIFNHGDLRASLALTAEFRNHGFKAEIAEYGVPVVL